MYKPADQTGMWKGLSADRAVVGRYGTLYDQKYCAHPDNEENIEEPVECWVDLENIYIVDNVTKYNTYDGLGKSREKEFRIDLSVVNSGVSITILAEMTVSLHGLATSNEGGAYGL